MNSPLAKGAIVGTVLQVLMVVCGHYVPQIAAMFPIVGTLIGGVAGFVATRGTGAALAPAAGNGAVAGLISGVLGTGVSVALGDVPMSTLAIAAGSTAVLGAIGGALARQMGMKGATA
jgi:hypothetical protein